MKTKYFIPFAFFLIFFSCEEESGYGDYIIGVSNASNNNILIQVLLDDVNQGSFVVLANNQGNYSNLCNDKVYAATLNNVKTLNYVSSGNHNIKLKDESRNHIYFDHSFDMSAGGCGAQQYNIK
jgi:hypothetical protein